MVRRSCPAFLTGFSQWIRHPLKSRLLALPLTLLLALALALSAPAHGQTAPPASQGTSGTMMVLQQEALGWLQDLIRINTSNPPGNEMAAANYIGAILEREGIPHEVIEITPGRGIVIGKLSASVMPDSAHAL